MNSRTPPLTPFKERVLAAALSKRAESSPRHRVLEFPTSGISWTLEQLTNDARRFAGGLRSIDIEYGERVAIMLKNRPEYVLAWWGSLFAGTIDVSINHELKGSLLQHQMSVASVNAIICDSESYSSILEVADIIPSLKTIVIIGSPPARKPGTVAVVEFSQLLSGQTTVMTPRHPSDVTSIRYTSGTTGPAKAVGMTNSEIVVMADHFAWLTQLGSSDRLYTSFPMHHGVASILGVVPTILQGGCCIVDQRFSASMYWRQISKFEATLGHIISPLIPILMTQDPGKQDRDHNCSRLWTAYRTPEFEERFNTRTIMIYGSSEGGVMAYTAPGDDERPLSCGIPSPLIEMKIVDEDGFEAPPGTEGELIWRPREPHLMFDGYFGDPEATARSMRGLWFHPGDVCRMDESGHLYLIGRTGDQIRRKGVNIPAASIEEVAKRIPGIIEAAAIAVPSELGESEVKLCLLRPGTTPIVSEVEEFLARNLPRTMRPRYLQFRESLPRTDTHKISKYELRREGDRGLTDDMIDLEVKIRMKKSSISDAL